VSAHGKWEWRAFINHGGKQHWLGRFGTKQGASLAYDRAARRCGEEKALNFESTEEAEEAAAWTRAHTQIYTTRWFRLLIISRWI
jgi:hypothetical protein